VKKKVIPLSMLLLAAHIVVNYRRVLGLFTSSFLSGGFIGILQFLVNVATTVIPIIMLVLLFLHIAKDKPATNTIRLLCFIMGSALLIDFGLTLYRDIFLLHMDLYGLFPQFSSIGALLIYGIGMLQIGSKLRKNKLRANVDSHSMPGVTTVTCPSCHKTYTDNSNKRSINRSNMCTNCKIGFEATKDALGW
jgi:hypothetical protein